MFDFHKAITAFHDEMVTLPQSLRNEMRERRDANRARLDRGLEKHNKPKPNESITQGSYAMKTMIRHENNDYDIDDGIYFKRSQLKTKNGNDVAALAVRQMVCDALQDDSRFNDPPEVKTNCVRVHYGAGYHVDIPIYRTDESGNNPKLASADWVASNAKCVKEWFCEENKQKSPDEQNGRQLRRVVRLLKCFAKSRASWKDTLPSGFALTILVCECFHPHLGRDDISFYNTLCNIYHRLNQRLDIWHPKTPNTLVNSGADDAKTRNLRDNLRDNLKVLGEIVIPDECEEHEAAGAWGAFFGVNYFVEFISRSSNNIAVTEALFIPSEHRNSPLPPPNLWSGRAAVSVVKREGPSVLNCWPKNLPHVTKSSWKQVSSLDVNINGTYEVNGQKKKFSSGDIIPKEAGLYFSCVSKQGLPFSKNDYYVKWQVVNTCDEAGAASASTSTSGMRGGFENSNPHGHRKERSLYCGIHWIEAFLIRKRDRALCGRSGRFFVVVDEQTAQAALQ